MAHAAFRAGEVDQHIRAAQRCFGIGDDPRAAFDDVAQQRAAFTFQRRMQRQIVGLRHAFQQRLAHAPAAAGDGDPNLVHIRFPYFPTCSATISHAPPAFSSFRVLRTLSR